MFLVQTSFLSQYQTTQLIELTIFKSKIIVLLFRSCASELVEVQIKLERDGEQKIYFHTETVKKNCKFH